MGEVKRSDSKGNINNLLSDIRGIVNDNKETLDGLKAIKQKNEEHAKTKRRVDIPSVVSGYKNEEGDTEDNPDQEYLYFPLRKWSEIDIPHKRAKGGERESEINRRNKKFTLPEPQEPIPDPLENQLPVIEADTMGPVESAPPPKRVTSPDPLAQPLVPEGTAPQRLPRRERSEERRRDRRDKSIERKKRMDAIRQKANDRKKEPDEPKKEPEKPAKKPEETRTPRRGRDSKRRQPEKKPEEEQKPEPPSRRVRPVPAALRDSVRPARTRRTRPSRPDEADGGLPTVEVGSGPTEHAGAPEPPAPEPPTRLSSITRGRTPSGHSDHGGHGHLFRIRKHSEGSVEIFPDYIEEHKVTSEYKVPSLSSSNENIPASPTSRPGVSPGLSLPRSIASRWYSKADMSSATSYSRQSSMKRRIILERCPHCQDGDSPPEIEIRICKRSARCGKFRSQEDIHIIPQESLNLESKPSPPARASSLNRIPPSTHSINYDTPLSPTLRAQSPSEREMQRLASRLEALKKEVTSVIRDCEDDVPLNVSIRDVEDRPKSPYYPDKTPYYRARYHSAPQSPTGQNDKTTSTTELPQVYHPAKEELTASQLPATVPEVLLLSTQSLEIPEEDEVPVTDQLELEVESLTETQAPELQSHFVPVQNQAPESYDEVYDPECDLGVSTNHVNLDLNNRPKREEQLLTPPPLPERAAGPQPDITLRGDNLYDPYHIGTTFVVLSRQNHGRFKFSNPLDPNISAPGSPKPSTPVSTPIRGSPLPVQNGSTAGSSPKSVPRSEPAEMPDIAPVVAAPVSAAPPPATPPPATPPPATPPATRPASRRPLYQPKSLNGSLMSLTSPSRQDIELDTTPSKLIESPKPFENDTKPAPVQNGGPPPLPARNPGMMSPDKRRGFQRPAKEPTYREVPVDALDRPILPERKHSLQEQQKNSASREFHLQTIMDVEKPGRLDTWSGAMPPAESRGAESRPGAVVRPFSPHSENSLRRTMPHVKLLGDEWKELAQKLGYENSHIASFARDYPDPGQALLDHWSRLPESRLDDLLRQLKSMDLWKTADTLDKTFDNTNV